MRPRARPSRRSSTATPRHAADGSGASGRRGARRRARRRPGLHHHPEPERARGNPPGGVRALWPRLSRPDAVIVARLGAEGAVLHRRGSAPLRVPGHPVDVVDSTGAGDAHAGALLAMLAEGLGMEEALRRANIAAALAVAVEGSAAGPTRERLDAALGS
ncbi:carbohydrate kinase family protein [Tessaracoccus coleopterorum]|uniref:carbohydrate kinase family protein n=1 Tax=Tessaracoccus coleopterorum TaxID=2714950 RepID=UPI002F91902A